VAPRPSSRNSVGALHHLGLSTSTEVVGKHASTGESLTVPGIGVTLPVDEFDGSVGLNNG